MALYYIVCEL